jgi:hypothetical protein
MTPFTWLLVAHLVGDWLFQNDWMAQGKKRGLFTWAGWVHFSIYTLCVLIALRLASDLKRPITFYLIQGLIVLLSHWLIDASNLVSWWIRLFKQTDIPLVRIMVDQTLHVLVLVVVAIQV